MLTLRRHYARPSVESDRGYTKAPRAGETRGLSGDPRTTKTTADRRYLIGYCFSYPIFAAGRPKKGSGTIGTKTILGKMAALASILFCFGIKTYRRSDSQLWDTCITLLKHNDIFHVHFIDRCVYITSISCLPLMSGNN